MAKIKRNPAALKIADLIFENYDLKNANDANEALKEVPEYKSETYFTFGYPGDEIVKKAKEDDIDIIVMTKSTRKGLTRMIGSVTINVVKHAKCSVMIVPE